MRGQPWQPDPKLFNRPISTAPPRIQFFKIPCLTRNRIVDLLTHSTTLPNIQFSQVRHTARNQILNPSTQSTNLSNIMFSETLDMARNQTQNVSTDAIIALPSIQCSEILHMTQIIFEQLQRMPQHEHSVLLGYVRHGI